MLPPFGCGQNGMRALRRLRPERKFARQRVPFAAAPCGGRQTSRRSLPSCRRRRTAYVRQLAGSTSQTSAGRSLLVRRSAFRVCSGVPLQTAARRPHERACRSPPPPAADGRPRVARCPPAAVGELPMCGSPSVRRRRRRRAAASPREGPQLAQGSRASPRKLRPIFHSLRYSPNELPPMNSRRIEVGGISSGIIGTKLSRNLSMRRASSYSGIVSGTSRSSGSA